MAGEELKLSKDTLRKILLTDGKASRFLKSLVPFINTPDKVYYFLLDEPATDMDFFWTIIRLEGVFSNLFANDAHTDAAPTGVDGPLNFQRSAPYSYLAMAGAGIAALVGVARGLYQRQHKAWLKGDEYFIQQLGKVAPDQLDDEDGLDRAILARIGVLRTRAKTLSPADKNKEVDLKDIFKDIQLSDNELIKKLLDKIDADVLPVLVADEIDTDSEDARNATLVLRIKYLMRFVKAQKIMQRVAELQKKVKNYDTDYHAIADLKPKIAFLESPWIKKPLAFLDGVWSKIKESSYIYWLAWMFPLISFGVAAAAGSVLVAAIPLGFIALFQVAKLAIWAGKKLAYKFATPTERLEMAKRAKEEKDKKDLESNPELVRQKEEAKLRLFISEHHDASVVNILRVLDTTYTRQNLADKKRLKVKPASVPVVYDADYKKGLTRCLAEDMSKEELEAFIRDKFAGDKNAFHTALNDYRKEHEAVLIRFLGSKHIRRGRLVATGMVGIIKTFVMVAFGAWYATAFLGSLLAPIAEKVGLSALSDRLTNAAKVVGDSKDGLIGTAGFGGALGALLGFNDVYQLYFKQKNYQHKVMAVLSAQYKNTDKSNLEMYVHLKKSVKEKIAKLKAREGSESFLQRANFDLDAINLESDSYHEKYRWDASFATRAFTTIKRIGNGVYDFFCNSQTGIFCSRNLFLANAAAEGLVPYLAASLAGMTIFGAAAVFSGGTLLPFLLVTAAVMLTVGILGVVIKQYERNHRHREEAVDKFGARIKRLSKLDKDLDLVSAELTKEDALVSAGTVTRAPMKTWKDKLSSLPASIGGLFGGKKAAPVVVPAVPAPAPGLR